MANYLIHDMMEGYQYKIRQQSEVDAIYLNQLQQDMENSAIRNSMIENDNSQLEQ